MGVSSWGLWKRCGNAEIRCYDWLRFLFPLFPRNVYVCKGWGYRSRGCPPPCVDATPLGGMCFPRKRGNTKRSQSCQWKCPFPPPKHAGIGNGLETPRCGAAIQ